MVVTIVPRPRHLPLSVFPNGLLQMIFLRLLISHLLRFALSLWPECVHVSGYDDALVVVITSLTKAEKNGSV